MTRNLLLVLIYMLTGLSCAAQVQKSERIKPQWLTKKLPESKSPSYFFLNAEGMGASLEAARQMALVNLSTRLEHERGLVVSSTVGGGSAVQRGTQGESHTSYREFSMTATEKGKAISMKCRVIDEYWERRGGTYTCHVLYTIADQNAADAGSYDDRITLTTSYGARGLVRSIIPGWGQIYKGSTAKGACILAGEAVCAAGIIVCENQRASYHKKMKEQPRFAQTYNTKSDNWENGRNICIGAAAALYVYNLIDAVAAKGAKRVVVKKSRPRFAFYPVADAEHAGVALSMRF